MLKSHNGLTEQMFSKPFCNLLYTFYNLAEEEQYIRQLGIMGYDTDIESLECLPLVKDDVLTNDGIYNFKRYIENDLQGDNVVVYVLLYKVKNGLLPIEKKKKNVNLSDVLKN